MYGYIFYEKNFSKLHICHVLLCIHLLTVTCVLAMMNEVRPAVTCSLCTGVWVPSRVYKHDADSDLEMSETLGAQPMMEMAEDDIAGSVCYRCGNSAHFSRTMEVAATQV